MAWLGRMSPLFLKAASIGALTLILLWPLARVESLIEERQELEQQAQGRIRAAWGGEQWASGPLLVVPVQRRTWIPYESADDRIERWLEAEPLQLLADDLAITAEVRVSERHSGIYRMPVYETRVTATGHFLRRDLAAVSAASGGDERLRASAATISLPVRELARIRAIDRFEIDGRRLDVKAGGVAGLPALVASTSVEAGAERVPFRIEYTLAGSEALRFLPTARRTRVEARGNWHAPRFDGLALPASPRVGTDGFSARWDVLEINHGLPAAWRGTRIGEEALGRAAFGFDLFDAGDVYARNWRAVRYGVLFIAVTFLCLFVWEHGRTGRPLHPMNYLLVGLALAVFYLLLLSLSEQVGFAAAYAASAAALIALLAWYVAGVLQGWKPASALAGVLATAYAALYAVLDSEDYALLMGATMVFAALATLMISTRRVDWAAVGRTRD